MRTRACLRSEPETIHERFGANWGAPVPDRLPIDLTPSECWPVIRVAGGQRVVDVIRWGLPGVLAAPTTFARDLRLPQWRELAEAPESRCLVPLTAFCEWTPFFTDLQDGSKPIRGEMWFEVLGQSLFAVGGLWQQLKDGGRGFVIVTCDPNDLVAPINPEAMMTVLATQDHKRWLTCSHEEMLQFQRPYPGELMQVRGPVFPTKAAA